jgi:hypothetical protein
MGVVNNTARVRTRAVFFCRNGGYWGVLEPLDYGTLPPRRGSNPRLPLATGLLYAHRCNGGRRIPSRSRCDKIQVTEFVRGLRQPGECRPGVTRSWVGRVRGVVANVGVFPGLLRPSPATAWPSLGP